MHKTKTQAEPTIEAERPTTDDVKKETPKKQGEPVKIARAAKELASSEAAAGTPKRAQTTGAMQGAVGNARVGMLASANSRPAISSKPTESIQRQKRGRRRAAGSILSPFVGGMVSTVRGAVERGDYISAEHAAPPGYEGPPAPGGAFYYLNGLSPSDLVETLQALGPVVRGKLRANIGLTEGHYDRPRLEAALRSVSWGEGPTGKQTLSLLDAIRNVGTGTYAPVFKQLERLPRIELLDRLRTLDRANLQLLHAHVADADPTEQAKLTEVLDDLLQAPTAAASDVIDVQGLRGLDRVMAGIYNKYGQYLESEAHSLGIGTATAAAIMQVESGGKTFDRGTDKPIIRFEAHVFWDQWGHSHATTFNKHFDFDRHGHHWEGHMLRTGTSGPFESYHGSQVNEWRAVSLAASLASQETAYRSMSVGAGQIMGFNFGREGYASAKAMVDAFSRSERAQLGSIFDFIRNTGLVSAVQHGDLETLAERYNGAGKKHEYAALIRSRADIYRRVTAGKRHVIPD